MTEGIANNAVIIPMANSQAVTIRQTSTLNRVLVLGRDVWFGERAEMQEDVDFLLSFEFAEEFEVNGWDEVADFVEEDA